MTEGDIIAQFVDAMRGRGIIPPNDLLADGKLHRCDAAGRNGKDDAAYLLHLDGIAAGGYENWRDGLGWSNWCCGVRSDLTAAERAAYRERIAQARAQRDAEDHQRRSRAAERARFIWQPAPQANDHTYLRVKRITAHGARLYRGLLTVPVTDENGIIVNLQFIDETGSKRFLSDGRKSECCSVIGDLTGSIIVVCEGFATAASLHEATGHPVVAAFDAGNLPPVAAMIRRRFPAAKIVVAADDDHRTEGNPGYTKAQEAASLVNGVVAVPDFGADRPEAFTDFNDLAFFAGHDHVREIIDAALVAPARRRGLLLPIRPASLEGVLVPERQWLVGDWVQIARATAFYGAGGEGKTILAQMLATACAIGKPWLGLPTMRCNSLLLYCEDDLDEMHRRQHDINAYYGCSYADLDAMLWLPRLGDDNALMEFDAGRPRHTALFDDLVATAKDHQAKLVVHDTLADVFVGNENDRSQARAFVQHALGLIAREINGAAVVLAHPSRTGVSSGSGDSGSTGWVGTFRSQLYLATPRVEKDKDSEPVDPNMRILTRRKSNSARRGDEIELRWRDGIFEPTSPGGIIDRVAAASKAERVFLALLRSTYAMNRWCSPNPKAGASYAPTFFMTLPEREGVTRAAFETAMNKLLNAGNIKTETYGPPSAERIRLAPC